MRCVLFCFFLIAACAKASIPNVALDRLGSRAEVGSTLNGLPENGDLEIADKMADLLKQAMDLRNEVIVSIDDLHHRVGKNANEELEARSLEMEAKLAEAIQLAVQYRSLELSLESRDHNALATQIQEFKIGGKLVEIDTNPIIDKQLLGFPMIPPPPYGMDNSRDVHPTEMSRIGPSVVRAHSVVFAHDPAEEVINQAYGPSVAGTPSDKSLQNIWGSVQSNSGSRVDQGGAPLATAMYLPKRINWQEFAISESPGPALAKRTTALGENGMAKSVVVKGPGASADAQVGLNDRVWAAIPAETRAALSQKYVIARDEALTEGVDVLQWTLLTDFPGVHASTDEALELVKKHITATDGRRRLNEAEGSAISRETAEPEALYFRSQQYYDTLFSDKALTARGLTPRDMLVWLDTVIQAELPWVEEASRVTLGNVWDYLVGSRAATMPKADDTTTANAYSETFWFKPVVTSQITRRQHMLGYSVFQLQLRAQLARRDSSPTESHGSWPWFTNEQIVKMVKQYDMEKGGNASSVSKETEIGSVQTTAPQFVDRNTRYQLAGIRAHSQAVTGVPVVLQLPKVEGANISSEALRAIVDLQDVGMPVKLMEGLSSQDLESLKVEYERMMSERALMSQQGRPETYGVWPYLSWDDLVNMAKPHTSNAILANRPSLQHAKTLGFSDELLQDLDEKQIQTAIKLFDDLVEDQQAQIASNSGLPHVRGVWPWMSWEDLVNMAKPHEIDIIDGPAHQQSPEERYAKKQAQAAMTEEKAKSADVRSSVDVIGHETPVMPSEIVARIQDANTQSRLTAHANVQLIEAPSPPIFPGFEDGRGVDAVMSSNQRGGTAARSAARSIGLPVDMVGQIAIAPRPDNAGGADDFLSKNDASAFKALPAMSRVFAQLQILDTMLS